MDDNNISYLVTNLLPISNSYYKGTFTCDRISNAPELKIKFNSYKEDFLSFIVNTHRSYDSPNKVGHWIAIVVLFDKSLNKLSVRYLDSFADVPKKYPSIYTYVSNLRMQCLNNSVRWELNKMTHPIQAFNSKVCGAYSICCVVECYKKNKTKLNDIFKNFKRDRKVNDKKIIDYVRYRWPSKVCHMSPINNKLKVPLGHFKHKQVPPFCLKKTLNASSCFKNCMC